MDANASSGVGKKPKWNVQKRLEFIEFRLFWDGRLNRKDIVDTFGISAQQASADIATYEELKSHNLKYDAAQKCYLRTDSFSPLLIEGWTHRYLLQLVAIESGWMDQEDTWFENRQPIEIMTLTKKRVSTSVLMCVLDGIRQHKKVEMFYRSMTGSAASDRVIEPHALTYNSGSWYVRAWSAEHNDFRDYNLNRIETAKLSGAAETDRTLDFQWHHSIDLIIIPNPKLPPERQAAVEYEYQMEGGQTKLNSRLSVSFYLMAEHNLDVDEDVLNPLKQQLVLKNKEEVLQARSVARKLSKEALERSLEAR